MNKKSWYWLYSSIMNFDNFQPLPGVSRLIMAIPVLYSIGRRRKVVAILFGCKECARECCLFHEWMIGRWLQFEMLLMVMCLTICIANETVFMVCCSRFWALRPLKHLYIFYNHKTIDWRQALAHAMDQSNLLRGYSDRQPDSCRQKPLTWSRLLFVGPMICPCPPTELSVAAATAAVHSHRKTGTSCCLSLILRRFRCSY